jgi:RNA polymerase sigma-70 factor (ECF subfamily)
LAAFHKIDSFQGKSQPKTWLFSILNKVIDYYRLSARTTKKNFSLTENSGYELSDGLLIVMDAGKIMISTPFGIKNRNY